MQWVQSNATKQSHPHDDFLVQYFELKRNWQC